jgi:divalent metal cation (Fe/Co/Zn/Cd) transporter
MSSLLQPGPGPLSLSQPLEPPTTTAFQMFSDDPATRRRRQTCTFIQWAFALSWISLLLTVVAFVAGLVVAVNTSSSATLGFALENAVDFFSSALVCWRFWGGGATVPESELVLREKRASVGIAMSFVVLACVVGGVASGHLGAHERPSDLGILVSLAAPSAVCFGVLGALKMWVGLSTRSPSMRKDAACSLCGAFLSVGTCVSAGAVTADESVWFLDALVAILVSVGLLLYGAYVLAKNAAQRNRWWTASFWWQPSARIVVDLPSLLGDAPRISSSNEQHPI